MKPKKNHIIVRVNLSQKEKIDLGGISMQLVPKFTTNYREKNPCLCEVIDGNKVIKKGTILICHHNLFRDDSPFRVYDDFFSIPLTRNIFCSIDENGGPHGLFGNLMAKRIEETSPFFELAASYKGNLRDRAIAIETKEGVLKGEMMLMSKFSDYEIVYVWNGKEKRAIRIFFEDIVAIIEN